MELANFREGVKFAYRQMVIARMEQGRAPEVDYSSGASIQQDEMALRTYNNEVEAARARARESDPVLALRYKYNHMSPAQRQQFQRDEWCGSGPDLCALRPMPEDYDPVDSIASRWRFQGLQMEATMQAVDVATLGVAGGGVARRLAFRLEGELTAQGFFAGSYEVGAAGGFQWGARTPTAFQAARGGTSLAEAGDKFGVYASRAKPEPGYVDYAIHGNENPLTPGFKLNPRESSPVFNHRVLASMINGDPNFLGQPVRLLVCNPGGCNNAAIQSLANKLGVPIRAPQDLIWVQIPVCSGVAAPISSLHGEFWLPVDEGRHYLPQGSSSA